MIYFDIVGILRTCDYILFNAISIYKFSLLFVDFIKQGASNWNEQIDCILQVLWWLAYV